MGVHLLPVAPSQRWHVHKDVLVLFVLHPQCPDGILIRFVASIEWAEVLLQDGEATTHQ
jgi:hypothetical protein